MCVALVTSSILVSFAGGDNLGDLHIQLTAGQLDVQLGAAVSLAAVA